MYFADTKCLKCDQCGFSASYANDLREHMLKHTGTGILLLLYKLTISCAREI